LAATAGALADPLRRNVRQLEVDLAYHRLLAERAQRYVGRLQTLAEILEAHYQRWLALLAAAFGGALAAGQVVDDKVAQVICPWLPGLTCRLLAGGGLAPADLLRTRLAAMALTGLLLGLAMFAALSGLQRRRRTGS
jgi:ABC-type transporter Mla subunit MlaD